jgi:ABC-2 type transport system permease protein
MRTLAAAFRLQVQYIRRVPDYLLPAVVAPIMGTVFLLVVRQAGREDLAGAALLAPALIGLWHASLNIAGEVITGDRGSGVFEALVATPVSLPLLVLGRVLASTALGLAALFEMGLLGTLVFGVDLQVRHPLLLAVVLTATAAAATGHAVLMAATFVLGRSSRPFQRALTFPFYLLGGVIVPVELLPEWARAASRVVFLSWSSGLLRDSLRPGPVEAAAFRLATIAGLGGLALGVGWTVTVSMVNRARRLGTMTYA